MLAPVKPPSELSADRLVRRLGVVFGFSIVGALIVIVASAVDDAGRYAGVVALVVIGGVGPAAAIASYRFTRGRLAAGAVGLVAAAFTVAWIFVYVYHEATADGATWG